MKTLARDKKKVLLSFEHVSRETGLATDSLRKMAAKGQLMTVPCNRVVRIPACELARLTCTPIGDVK